MLHSYLHKNAVILRPAEVNDPMNRRLVIANSDTLIRWQCVRVIVLTIVLSGCAFPSATGATAFAIRGPFSCAKITESYWKEFSFGVDSPEDTVSTVARLWNIDESQIRYKPAGGDVLFVDWGNLNDGRGYYSAKFGPARKLINIAIRFQPSPKLTQVIDCLGFPDHYWASYNQEIETRSLSSSIWYEEKGLIFNRYAIQNPWRDPKVRSDDVMNGPHFVVAPGPPEKMVAALYPPGQEPTQQEALEFVKPWPGSIEAMEVDWNLQN